MRRLVETERGKLEWRVNKYGAKRTIGPRGLTYDSKAEARHAERLELMRLAGEILNWEYAPGRYPLEVNGATVGHYRPDFLVAGGRSTRPIFTRPSTRFAPAVDLPAGAHAIRYELHEVKGYAARDWPLRRKLFEALYPELPLRVFDSKGAPKPASGPRPKRAYGSGRLVTAKRGVGRRSPATGPAGSDGGG